MNKLSPMSPLRFSEGRALYEPPVAVLFSITAPQNILVTMSVELEADDFDEGAEL
ncbi:hypothetical protein [Porphyromonas sp.]